MVSKRCRFLSNSRVPQPDMVWSVNISRSFRSHSAAVLRAERAAEVCTMQAAAKAGGGRLLATRSKGEKKPAGWFNDLEQTGGLRFPKRWSSPYFWSLRLFRFVLVRLGASLGSGWQPKDGNCPIVGNTRAILKGLNDKNGTVGFVKLNYAMLSREHVNVSNCLATHRSLGVACLFQIQGLFFIVQAKAAAKAGAKAKAAPKAAPEPKACAWP